MFVNNNDDDKNTDNENNQVNANNTGNNENSNDTSNGDDGSANNNGSNPTDDDKSSGGKTFTQEDVNRMMTKEKQQGRNSVYNELGIDPGDSNAINMIKALMNSRNQPDDDKSNSNEEMLAAEHRAKVAEAKVEAMTLGVKPQFVDDVVTLATVKMSEQDGAEFKTVIGEMKSKYPTWFGADDDVNSTGKKGTGSSVGSESGTKGSANDDGIGKRLAARRKTSNGKNFSYWGKN